MAIEDLERFVDESVAKAGGVSPFTLRERYRGVMLGIAAGNALGLPAEGLRCKQIATRFPGGLVEVDPREKERPWDDDLAQTVLLAEALLDGEELNLAMSLSD
jgi:ADP-ribosylglycohydrolase